MSKNIDMHQTTLDYVSNELLNENQHKVRHHFLDCTHGRVHHSRHLSHGSLAQYGEERNSLFSPGSL